MDHVRCLTCRFVSAKGWGDAFLHRNREAFVHLKKVAKMSENDHKSPSQAPATRGEVEGGGTELPVELTNLPSADAGALGQSEGVRRTKTHASPNPY